MIFVPSRGGISHNPREFTADDDIIAGADILLDVTSKLTLEE
jgi:N-carbamoyl-L-amino-acid hydrolase